MDEPLPAPYTGMDAVQLYRALGVSNRIYEFNRCFICHEDLSVRHTRRQIDGMTFEVITETPVGSQRAIYQKSPNNPWHKSLKWPISDEAEMKVAAWRKHRETWTWDQAAYENLCTTWADLGAATIYLPRVNVQHLFIEDMGVEETIYALHDYGAACEAYFEAIEVCTDRMIDVVNGSPVEIIDSPYARLFYTYQMPVPGSSPLFRKRVVTPHHPPFRLSLAGATAWSCNSAGPMAPSAHA